MSGTTFDDASEVSNVGLNKISGLAKKINASDKAGSHGATAFIMLMAVCISCMMYWASITFLPCKLGQYIKDTNAKYSQKYNKKKNPYGSRNDPFDSLDFSKTPLGRAVELLEAFFDHYLGKILLLGGVSIGGGVYYRKRRKAAIQRQMQKLMKEEIEILKEAVTKEATAGGSKEAVATKLGGMNLVQIFKSFTDIMKYQGKIPREEQETALEYFLKVAKVLRFPESESRLAAKFFEDELYGKNNTTDKERKAFLDLLLKMMAKL